MTTIMRDMITTTSSRETNTSGRSVARLLPQVCGGRLPSTMTESARETIAKEMHALPT